MAARPWGVFCVAAFPMPAPFRPEAERLPPCREARKAVLPCWLPGVRMDMRPVVEGGSALRARRGVEPLFVAAVVVLVGLAVRCCRREGVFARGRSGLREGDDMVDEWWWTSSVEALQRMGWFSGSSHGAGS